MRREVPAGGTGWAADTLERALHSTFLLGLAGFQVVMIAAFAVAPNQGDHWLLLVAAHGVLMLLALASYRGWSAPLWLVVLGAEALLVCDWSVARSLDGVVVFAAAWFGNLAHLLPVMLARGRRAWALSVVDALAAPVAVAIVHPGWTTPAVSIAITGIAMRCAARLALRILDRFARSVDWELDVSEAEHRAVVASEVANSESAEHARTLHDTVINTLAAVASGGGAVRDLDLVRERCARDIRTFEALETGAGAPAAVLQIGPLVAELGLVADRCGLSDRDLALAGELLPSEVVRALGGATREALRNVAKHASSPAVDLLVTDDDGELLVVVRDHGPGFDGQAVAGRGLAESVLARSEAVGISATVVSEPGVGTEIRLRYPLGALPLARPDTDSLRPQQNFMDTVDWIRRWAGWLWSAAVLGVGIVIEVTNSFGKLTWCYGMLALVALAIAAAWRDVRGTGFLRNGTTVLLVLSVPAAFLFPLAGVDFARHDAFRWQAIGVSAPLALLMVHARTRTSLAVALSGLVATATASAVAVAHSSTQAAVVIAIGLAPPLGVVGAWFWFYRAVERVGRRAADEQRAASASRLERATREAVADARRRWRDAGVRDCITLLGELAEGAIDPRDGHTRARCAEAEAYLRQLVLLNAALFRTGEWFLRALARSRSRGVRLVVRSGDHDVDSDPVAASLGSLMWDAIGAAPPGSDITVSLFPSRGRLWFALVAPRPSVAAALEGWRAPEGWRVETSTHDAAGMIEAVGPLMAEPPTLGDSIEARGLRLGLVP